MVFQSVAPHRPCVKNNDAAVNFAEKSSADGIKTLFMPTGQGLY